MGHCYEVKYSDICFIASAHLQKAPNFHIIISPLLLILVLVFLKRTF